MQAFGVEWVRKWLIFRERLVEIANVLRRFPLMVEIYVAKNGSEVCLSLNPPKAFCAQNGAVKKV